MCDGSVQTYPKQFNQMSVSGVAASYSFRRLAAQALQKRVCNSLKGRRSETSRQLHKFQPSPVTN